MDGCPDDLLAVANNLPFSKQITLQDTLDWVILRGSRTPGPADYHIRGMSENLKGGSFGKSAAKTSQDWEVYRAMGIPGPEYDVDHSYRYLEGKNGRAGAKFLGRQSPSQMPAPYAQHLLPDLGNTSKPDIRYGPSESHTDSLTPWRLADWKDKKAEAARALSRLRGVQGATVGKGERKTGLEHASQSHTTSLTPWRDPRVWSAHDEAMAAATPGGRPATALAVRHEEPEVEARDVGMASGRWERPSSAPLMRGPSVDYYNALLPWRDKVEWEKVNKQEIAERKARLRRLKKSQMGDDSCFFGEDFDEPDPAAQLKEFMQKTGLSRHHANFERERVNFASLQYLEKEKMLSMGLNAGEIALLQKAIKKVVAGGLDALDTLFSVERPPKPPFRGAHGRRRSRGREGTTSFSNTEFTGSMSSITHPGGRASLDGPTTLDVYDSLIRGRGNPQRPVLDLVRARAEVRKPELRLEKKESSSKNESGANNTTTASSGGVGSTSLSFDSSFGVDSTEAPAAPAYRSWRLDVHDRALRAIEASRVMQEAEQSSLLRDENELLQQELGGAQEEITRLRRQMQAMSA